MFSFKINKKATSSSTVPVVSSSKGPSITARTKAFDDDDKDVEEPDFIDGLDGDVIVSKKQQKKTEKKELVIPLITKNEWRIDGKKKGEGEHHVERNQKPSETVSKNENDGPTQPKEVNSVDDEDSLKQQAIKEILAETSGDNAANQKNSKSIPLLFQNKIPDGYEEEDNMDVSLRPDESSLDDYERIPIQEFGLAMLRGMGWKEEEGIGLKNKKVVDMAEPKLRPKGMGLGAEKVHLNKDSTPTTAGNPEKEDLTVKIGAFAIVNRGSKKGYYGQIESLDEDNSRVILRLAISGKMEAISKFYIDVVSSKEYKTKSKVINSEKYEEFKSKQERKSDYEYEDEPSKHRAKESRRRSRSRSRSRDRKSSGSKHKTKRERDRYDDHDRKKDRRRDRHDDSRYSRSYRN